MVASLKDDATGKENLSRTLLIEICQMMLDVLHMDL